MPTKKKEKKELTVKLGRGLDRLNLAQIKQKYKKSESW